MNGGYGVFQQFTPETRNRHAAAGRLDYQPSGNDTVFLRGSHRHRDPSSILFEGGNALDGPPDPRYQDEHGLVRRRMDESVVADEVNEMRIGYNLDTSKRQSTFHAADVSAQLGLDPAPSLGPDRLGFPTINFQSGPNRPTNIADAGRNVDRTVDQNAFSISDNFTWITAHTRSRPAGCGTATWHVTGSDLV